MMLRAFRSGPRRGSATTQTSKEPGGIEAQGLRRRLTGSRVGTSAAITSASLRSPQAGHPGPSQQLPGSGAPASLQRRHGSNGLM